MSQAVTEAPASYQHDPRYQAAMEEIRRLNHGEGVKRRLRSIEGKIKRRRRWLATPRPEVIRKAALETAELMIQREQILAEHPPLDGWDTYTRQVVQLGEMHLVECEYTGEAPRPAALAAFAHGPREALPPVPVVSDAERDRLARQLALVLIRREGTAQKLVRGTLGAAAAGARMAELGDEVDAILSHFRVEAGGSRGDRGPRDGSTASGVPVIRRWGTHYIPTSRGGRTRLSDYWDGLEPLPWHKGAPRTVKELREFMAHGHVVGRVTRVRYGGTTREFREQLRVRSRGKPRSAEDDPPRGWAASWYAAVLGELGSGVTDHLVDGPRWAVPPAGVKVAGQLARLAGDTREVATSERSLADAVGVTDKTGRLRAYAESGVEALIRHGFLEKRVTGQKRGARTTYLLTLPRPEPDLWPE